MTRVVEFTGKPFGRPDDILTAEFEAQAVGLNYIGQDSVTASTLTPGLDFYGFYTNGTYANGTAVKARNPGKKYIGVTPGRFVGADMIDVEPGDALPADIPYHLRANANAPNLIKPGFYTSAGDIQACINAANLGGYQRSTYLIWSAHWIGRHLCGPSTCGYPQADITQYQSTTAYDSNITSAGIFKGAKPVPTPPKPKPAPPKTVTFIATWEGSDGVVSRKTTVPFEVWQTFKWENPE